MRVKLHNLPATQEWQVVISWKVNQIETSMRPARKKLLLNNIIVLLSSFIMMFVCIILVGMPDLVQGIG